ncbi:MAG: hypothetical protein IPL49_15660 [Saprospirales bacterium]|nr:hypothetical protein [Saprospirales bacterium]MBK8492273.1 hypothetical protein [Saprospirales bacterium]
MTKHTSNPTLRFALLAGLILFAAITRILPHPNNVTPVSSMALFGAAYFGRKYLAFLVPLLALWLSNLFLDNVVYSAYYDGFTWFSQPAVFVSFLLIIGLGWLALKKVSPLRLIGASLSASLLFFLVSNFGVWLQGGMYPQSFSGLMMCYAAGLPFFRNTVLGDLFFVSVLFGAFEWVQYRYPALRKQQIGA